jgi:hypothetical protein
MEKLIICTKQYIINTFTLSIHSMEQSMGHSIKQSMEQLIELWCNNHPSVTNHSIPTIPVLITKDSLTAWELREEDRADFENWFPIYVNGTGVHYTVYYYNLNKNHVDHGKILGMWCHCFSGDIEIKIVAKSIDEFMSNPKYASRISRSGDYSNGLKVSIMSDCEL